MPLYHCDVFMPTGLTMPYGTFELIYTKHALLESTRDRNGKMNLPTHLTVASCKVIEVEVENGEVRKVLYRKRTNGKHDMCFAVVRQGMKMIVKTVWLQRKDDNHRTLRRERYDTQ
jgi:hypothetical protein